MSSSEPFFPSTTGKKKVVKNDLDLQIGPLDGPDVIFGSPGEDPDVTTVDSRRDLPIAKPAIGEQLTERQLAEELEEAASRPTVGEG
jgi:hypothetical protein